MAFPSINSNASRIYCIVMRQSENKYKVQKSNIPKKNKTIATAKVTATSNRIIYYVYTWNSIYLFCMLFSNLQLANGKRMAHTVNVFLVGYFSEIQLYLWVKYNIFLWTMYSTWILPRSWTSACLYKCVCVIFFFFWPNRYFHFFVLSVASAKL